MLRHPFRNRAAMPPNAIRLPPEATAALARGELILAIKIVRAATGLGLKEAKEAVEAYAARTATHGHSNDRDALQAAPGKIVFPQQAVDALSQGQLIAAIKQLREANPKLGLKEAREAVDAALQKRSAAGPSRPSMQRVPTVVQGDHGRGGWWLAAILVVIAAWWLLSGRG